MSRRRCARAVYVDLDKNAPGGVRVVDADTYENLSKRTAWIMIGPDGGTAKVFRLNEHGEKYIDFDTYEPAYQIFEVVRINGAWRGSRSVVGGDDRCAAEPAPTSGDSVDVQDARAPGEAVGA